MKAVKDLSEDGRKAGITFHNDDCNNRIVNEALEKLDNSVGAFNGKDLSRFMKIKNQFDQHTAHVRKAFKKLIDKHAVMEPILDKDKKPVVVNGKTQMAPRQVPTPGGLGYDYKDPKAFKKDYKLLMSETFHIESYRLLTESLVKAQLTPKEIRALSMILSDADESIVTDRDPMLDDDDDEDELAAEAEDSSDETLPEVNGAATPSRPTDHQPNA